MFVGPIRPTSFYVLQEFKNNVLQPNSGDDLIIDCFCVTYEKHWNYKIGNLIHWEHGVLLGDSFLNFYESDSEINPALISLDILSKLKRLGIAYKPPLPNAIIPQFFQMKVAGELLSGLNYDYVIKTRFDVLFEEKLDLKTLLDRYLHNNNDTLLTSSTMRYNYDMLELDEEDEVEDAIARISYKDKVVYKGKVAHKKTRLGKINDPLIIGCHKSMLNYFNFFEHFPNKEYRKSLKPMLKSKTFPRAAEEIKMHHIKKVCKLNLAYHEIACGLFRTTASRINLEGRL